MTRYLLVLAVLMWAVTYPWRALPLLVAHVDRLPRPILAYLRLVGPAVLTALAAVNVLVAPRHEGGYQLHLGIELLAVLIGASVATWRRSMLPGLAAAVIIAASLRS